MRQTATPQQAMSTCLDFLMNNAQAIRGMSTANCVQLNEQAATAREHRVSCVTLYWERSWTASCHMDIRLATDRVRTLKGGAQEVTYSPEVNVAWSSTSRTVAEATAALALYREVVELAAEVQALLESHLIVETHKPRGSKVVKDNYEVDETGKKLTFTRR